MPGVIVKELTKRYGEVAAVEGLSLDVKPRELVALLGPSGCGKTTTLRAVARSLVVEPEILLLDEPLSNLDANLREEMRFEIRRLHEAFGITTLYVTHDQAEAMVISDRIAVLYRGRLVQIGTAHQLFEQPRTRFVADFIGKTNLIDGVAAAPDRVARGGLSLRGGSARLEARAAAAGSLRPPQSAPAPASSPRNPRAGVDLRSGSVP